jgi:hypothetical protein
MLGRTLSRTESRRVRPVATAPEHREVEMDRRSIPHVIGWLLVLGAVALVGTAQALPGTNTVDSGDIINGEVMRPDIGRNAVNSAKVANNSLTTADIKDETITAADIGPSAVGFSELGVNSVNSAKVIDGSLTGSDIANNSLTPADVNFNVTTTGVNACETGLVHSWARVKGSAGMPATFTTSTTHVDTTYNCSGQSVQVRRAGVGDYYVRFVGDPAALAQVTTYYSGIAADYDNIVTYRKAGDDFLVSVSEETGTGTEGWFVITTF